MTGRHCPPRAHLLKEYSVLPFNSTSFQEPFVRLSQDVSYGNLNANFSNVKLFPLISCLLKVSEGDFFVNG